MNTISENDMFAKWFKIHQPIIGNGMTKKKKWKMNFYAVKDRIKLILVLKFLGIFQTMQKRLTGFWNQKVGMMLIPVFALFNKINTLKTSKKKSSATFDSVHSLFGTNSLVILWEQVLGGGSCTYVSELHLNCQLNNYLHITTPIKHQERGNTINAIT